MNASQRKQWQRELDGLRKRVAELEAKLADGDIETTVAEEPQEKAVPPRPKRRSDG